MLRERLAVCLSDRLVQSALALQFKLWRLGQPWWLQSDSGRAGAKADRTQNKMYVICNVPSTRQAVSEHRELVHHSINISLMILYKNRLKKAKYSIFIKQVTTAVSHWEWQCEELESGLPSVRCWWKNWIRCTSRTHNWRVRGEKKKEKGNDLKVRSFQNIHSGEFKNSLCMFWYGKAQNATSAPRWKLWHLWAFFGARGRNSVF